MTNQDKDKAQNSVPDSNEDASSGDADNALKNKQVTPKNSKEYGGREGPDPTRFGDWEKNGRCIDF